MATMTKRLLRMAVLVRSLLAATSLLCAACGRPTPGGLNRPLLAYDQDITTPPRRLRMRPNQAIHLPVVVRNPGAEVWTSRGLEPVMLSYKWYADDIQLPAEGERTMLPGALGPGDSTHVQLRIVAPDRIGPVILAVSLVQEGVAWFLSKGGSALRIPVQLDARDSAASNAQRSPYAEDITSRVQRLSLRPGQITNLPVTIRNVSSEAWSCAGTQPITVSYRWFESGKMLPIDGERTCFPGVVPPGDSFSISVRVVAPMARGNLVLKVTMVREGAAWFMSMGAKSLDIPAAIY
jgi:hypothetical protein